jgi:GNAT superfamily N-acetyltransferase
VAEPATGPTIREASRDDFTRLREIEREADTMFAEVGIGPFSDSDDEDHLARAAVVFVAHDPPVGFASMGIVDGMAHLWQLAVLPSSGRRGLGTMLVASVCDWSRSHGFDAVTLTTFRDVPWNGPFYEKLGFRPLTDLTSGLAAVRQHERAIGDDDFGPRIAMRMDL